MRRAQRSVFGGVLTAATTTSTFAEVTGRARAAAEGAATSTMTGLAEFLLKWKTILLLVQAAGGPFFLVVQ
ncbi:MAG: hypothetical protein ACM359_18630 [Bacillota bacterium]